MSDIRKDLKPCPMCGKKETIPSQSPQVFYCANCLESFRIENKPAPSGLEERNLTAKDGALVRIEARYNAVVINYFEDIDSEGERYLRPIVSVECKDWNLKDELLGKAKEIIARWI